MTSSANPSAGTPFMPASERPTIDVNAVVEEQKVGGFAWQLIFWTFFVMLLDGFDFVGIAFVIPGLARHWDVSPGKMGPVVSAGVVGLMLGSFFFGWVGDKIGRKKTIILGCWIFGIFSLACMWAPSILGLEILRFFACFGLYAAVPNTIVLVNEFAPKRLKLTWTTAMFTGFTCGGVAAGFTAAAAIPRFGWPVMFFLGGAIPLALSIGLIFVLPESIVFLSLKEERWSKVGKLVSKLRPELTAPENARFIVRQEKRSENFKLKLLFEGALRYMTPVIWLFYLINSLAVFFLMSWMPVLIHTAGLSQPHADFTTALYQVGGVFGGLLVGVLIDRLGIVVIGIAPTVACIVVACLGLHMPELALMGSALLAGLFVLGTQVCITVLPPTVYPASYRSKAVGGVIGIGKIGAFIGPLIGGVLITRHLPLRQIFYVAAFAMLLSACFAFAFAVLYRRHFSGAAQSPMPEG